MNVIKRLETERREWEAEKAHYEENTAWYESEVARLQAENAKLQAAPPVAAVPISAPVQAHHEQQLKLMETIDNLRREVQSERDRRMQIEQLVGGSEKNDRLGMSQLDMTLAAAMRPMPASEEFTSLEDENLRLREELNASKEKVIELKRAAAKRSSDWRNELQTITEELATKQAVDEEAASLRKERSRLQEELIQTRELLGQRESVARAEIDQLKEQLLRMKERVRSTPVEEVSKISTTMTQRINELETELSEKTEQHNHLLSLFLKHAERPLEALRVHCVTLLTQAEDIPNSFVGDPSDIQQSLVDIVELLRWTEEVFQGYDDARKQRRSGYGRP